MLTELSGRLVVAQKEIERKLTAWAQDSSAYARGSQPSSRGWSSASGS